MKPHLLFLSLLFMLNFCTISSKQITRKNTEQAIEHNIEQSTTSISKFCEHVHRHKRFIFLLRKPITILRKKNYYKLIANNIKNNSIKDTDIVFNHPSTQSTIKQIKQVKNLSPLFNLWHDLAQFKYLEEGLLIKEFSQIILYLTKNILIMQMHKKKNNDIVPQINFTCNEALTHEVDEMVEIINLCTDSFLIMQNNSHSINLNDLWECTTTKNSSLINLEGDNYTEQCTLIYFLIQRLKYTYQLAFKLNKTKKIILEPEKIFSTQYSNLRVKRCQTEIEYSKALAPLFNLWEEFKEYRYINNPVFLKEFLCLILSIEKYLVLQSSTEQSPRIPIGHIIQLYNNIENLSIDELLVGIDTVAEILPEIIEHYELNSEMSWKEWTKKYWWVIVSAATITGKLIYNRYFGINEQTTTQPNHISTHHKPNTNQNENDIDFLESLENSNTPFNRSRDTRERSKPIRIAKSTFKHVIEEVRKEEKRKARNKLLEQIKNMPLTTDRSNKKNRTHKRSNSVSLSDNLNTLNSRPRSNTIATTPRVSKSDDIATFNTQQPKIIKRHSIDTPRNHSQMKSRDSLSISVHIDGKQQEITMGPDAIKKIQAIELSDSSSEESDSEKNNQSSKSSEEEQE